ncbi:MAG TPA: polysaccharide deacetylase family protein [Solirubrobacteraceae bacterium]|nr:polysaccharide deacetylase family protein [Solirubrobacteraceae bacterium]
MAKRRGSDEARRSPLTAGQLSARRAVWRRRRAQRRLTLAVVLVVAVGAVPAVALIRGSQSRRRAPVTRVSVGGSGADSPRAPASASPHPDTPDLYASVDAVLGYSSYVRLGDGRRRDVALTFDDGPGPYSGAIVRILRRLHAPATFFAIGRQVPLYRQVIAAEARDGFEVGDHTETHPFLSVLPAAVQRAQILDAARAIHAAGAPYPRLFRPPYGAFDAATLTILRAARMLVVLWSVDTSDYTRPGVARIVYVALSGAQPGAIILMHDGGGDRSETVAALPRIIRGLRRRGYQLVTVSQLVRDDPPPRHQPPPQPLSGTG